MVSSTTSSYTEAINVSPTLPQVLTRNVIPVLTRGLDASDVLECYALVRSAPLHGLANSTIHIQKTAIGIRYRPTGAAAIAAQQQHIEKLAIELTLEYGPQRFGPLLQNEAMPYIQALDDVNSFIGWENVGRVFYTTKIASENYLSSYYMASITGAVLSKMLVQSVEYAESKGRYQPFAIYSADNGRQVRSSSSVDFAQYVWKQLANLGVEIHPILPPPVYEARLWVNSWEKVVPQSSTANDAATFYANLYKCLEAIAMNDYSAFQPTTQPTVSPMPTLLPTISSAPTGDDSLTAKNGPDDYSTEIPIGGDQDESEADTSPSSSSEPLGTKTPPPSHVNRQPDEPHGNGAGGSGRRGLVDLHGDDDDVDDDVTTDYLGSNEGDGNLHEAGGGNLHEDTYDTNLHTARPTAAKTSYPAVTPSPSTSSPSTAIPQTEQDGVEKAKQAAADAQQAADEAKKEAHTEGETKAADAAQAAAHAAQAAADATSNAAALAAMDGLLSGDGTAMASIVTTCLKNPQYNIARMDENGTVTANAFLYRDGSHYYKLILTSPYLEIARINRALPKAVSISDFGNGGDVIDFTLALIVISAIFLLLVAIMQQMGYVCSHSLSRCQRWFFNPRKYDYEGNTLDDDDDDEFKIVEDAIPLSMGGRLMNISLMGKADLESSNGVCHTSERRKRMLSPQNSGYSIGSQSVPREVEMSKLASSTRRTIISDNDSNGSFCGEELEEDAVVVPERLYRDPDLVDMPYLKSTSKVAVPVGSNGRSNSLPSEMDAQGAEIHFS